MTQLFEIAVQFDEGKKEYLGITRSIPDDKLLVVRKPRLRTLLAELTRLIRSKDVELQKFPLPDEPSRIITEESAKGSRGLIVLPP